MPEVVAPLAVAAQRGSAGVPACRRRWSRCDYNIIMKTADTYVRARIDTETKERAGDALAAMGLSISDAIRVLMVRVAEERRMPFEVKAPNTATRRAMAELEAGKGKRVDSTAAMMADLNEDD